MVYMTYLYVRKDVSSMPITQEQALLKAFLQALYDDSYVSKCVDDYKLVKVDGIARDIAVAGIDQLILDPAAEEFQFEESTLLNVGQSDFVISAKRKNAVELDIYDLTQANEKILGRVDLLQAQVDQMQVLLSSLMEQLNPSGGNATADETSIDEDAVATARAREGP
jgi:hypothetical protein